MALSTFLLQAAQARSCVCCHCSITCYGCHHPLQYSSHNKIQLTATLHGPPQGSPHPSSSLFQAGHHFHRDTGVGAALLSSGGTHQGPENPASRPWTCVSARKKTQASRQYYFPCVTVKVYSEPHVLVWAAGPVFRGNTDSWIQFIRLSAETIIREGDK